MEPSPSCYDPAGLSSIILHHLPTGPLCSNPRRGLAVLQVDHVPSSSFTSARRFPLLAICSLSAHDTPTSSLRQAHSLTPLGNSKGAQAEFKVTYSGAFSYVSSGPCAYFHQGTCHIAFQFLLYMSISSTTLLTPWREELDLLFFYLQANHGTSFLVAAP